MIAQAKVNRAKGEGDDIDIETCFAMAGRK